jgi:hypothetical protein
MSGSRTHSAHGVANDAYGTGTPSHAQTSEFLRRDVRRLTGARVCEANPFSDSRPHGLASEAYKRTPPNLPLVRERDKSGSRTHSCTAS